MPDGAPRIIPAPPVSIISATDLGNVEVTKEGNHYLLTDPRGDIRPDGRGLGLYHLDTRILSTSILRLNGSQLTLLRGPVSGSRRGHDPADQPRAAAEPGRQAGGDPEPRPARAERHAHPPDPRRPPRAGRGRELSRRRPRTSTSSSGWAWTWPTSSRCAATPGRSAARSARSSCSTTRWSSATTGWTAAVGRRPWHSRATASNRSTTPRCLARRERRRPLDRAAPRPASASAIGWTVSDETVDIAPAATKSRRGSRRTAPRPRAALRGPAISAPTTSCSTGPSPAPSSTLGALHNDGPGPGEQYLAAGIPWFATLFGRDSIIAALETVAFIPTLAVATLEVLARLQATKDDPWHDAEPGKILHELRTGEMARAGETPHDAYYGSVDSTPLWLILLGEAHAWTGDDATARPAVAATRWLRSTGSIDPATSTATGSSNTSAARGSGCSTRAGRTRAMRSATPTDGPRRGRSRWPRSRATPTPPGVRWRGSPGTGARRTLAARLEVDADDARDPLRRRVLDARGALLRDRPRRREAPGRTASPRTPGRRCGRGSSRPSGPPGSRSGSSSRTCSPAGASGRSRPASPATTRSATTRARSGRTTTR